MDARAAAGEATGSRPIGRRLAGVTAEGAPASRCRRRFAQIGRSRWNGRRFENIGRIPGSEFRQPAARNASDAARGWLLRPHPELQPTLTTTFSSCDGGAR
jgi:hypothetical protein